MGAASQQLPSLGGLPDEPRLIADMPGHVCAVVDGVVRDTFDCTAWEDGYGLRVRLLGVYLPPHSVVFGDNAHHGDGWHRLQLAAETGTLPTLIRQSFSDPDGNECYCDYCFVGDSWKCESDRESAVDDDLNPYVDPDFGNGDDFDLDEDGSE